MCFWEKELEKKEIQEGLISACDCIDLIIAILRGSKSLKDAKACLISGDVSNIHFRMPGFEEEAKKLHFNRAPGVCYFGNAAVQADRSGNSGSGKGT